MYRTRARLTALAPTLILASACSSTPVAKSQPQSVALGQQTVKAVPAPAMPGVNVPAIKVDTVGYPTQWTKIAIFNIEPKDPVVKDSTGKVVLHLGPETISARGEDPASKDQVWQVDFSAITVPGDYLLASGEIESDLFVVGDGVYNKALIAGQKHFYFQRTRTALTVPYAEWEGTAYTRETASHVHDDVGWDLLDYPDKKRKWKVEGGWHDAGNYDMYIPSTGPSAQALLMAYEWAPEKFKDGDLNIPESGNGVPDILDETRWGLNWILSLQEDGGAFRHREAVMKWSPEGPADHDKTVRWIAGPSTSATAKAVAVLALAATIYKPFDEAFAARCEKAAKSGWSYLLATPKHLRVDGKGSEQPLWDDEPEFTDRGARFIAAAEMWSAFRDKSALKFAESALSDKETAPAEFLKGAWANLARWGMGRLALDPKTPEALRKEAGSRLLAAAEIMRPQVQDNDGYRCISLPEDYYWAHNSNLLEKAHILLMAARVAPEQKWLIEAARDQWHWILGRNPNGYSMVTRIGKGPTRIYHMEWGNMEPPPPGYLIGGPNGSNMGFLAPGAPAKALLWQNPNVLRSGVAADSMWHWRQSDLWDGGFVAEGQWTEGWWAVTEPDIYYNANLVLVAVAMQ